MFLMGAEVVAVMNLLLRPVVRCLPFQPGAVPFTYFAKGFDRIIRTIKSDGCNDWAVLLGSEPQCDPLRNHCSAP